MFSHVRPYIEGMPNPHMRSEGASPKFKLSHGTPLPESHSMELVLPGVGDTAR